MGIFGQEMKIIEGEEYTLESVTQDKAIAENFAQMTRTYNYKARIKPMLQNGKTMFQVWVSVQPTGNPVPVQVQK